MSASTVDFDWDSYWARFGDYSTSVPGTVYRERLVFKLLGELGPDDRLLDIGCGLGELAEALHHAYPTTPIRATDVAQSAVDSVKARVPDGEFFVRDLLVAEEVPERY